MKQYLFKAVLSIIIIITNFSWDQTSKAHAEIHLKGQPDRIYFYDTFRLTFAENTGAFLSLGADSSKSVKMWGLKILPTILLCGLLAHLLFSQGHTLGQISAYSFLLGGGMSNIYDRMAHGRVVDFMTMGVGNFRSGIFNFADVSILIGIVFLLLLMIRK